MLRILLTLIVIFIALIINEILWHKKKIKNEVARKTIHISVAVFAAFWPYYLSYKKIDFIAVAFIIVIIASHFLGLFQSIKQVKRISLGDYFFPIGILIVGLVAPRKEIFTVAMLCVGLSDGFAALIGQKYGRHNRYKTFNGFKSLAGSLTVFVLSLVIVVLVNYFAGMNLPIISLFFMPLGVSIVEAISPFGVDDLLIPITVLLILNAL
jgi:dolichol kinase